MKAMIRICFNYASAFKSKPTTLQLRKSIKIELATDGTFPISYVKTEDVQIQPTLKSLTLIYLVHCLPVSKLFQIHLYYWNFRINILRSHLEGAFKYWMSGLN